LRTDGGSDAPLIKKIGVQRDSEVYGAFVKATEAGEEVRALEDLLNIEATVNCICGAV
jgi:hypothetical protein